jgi:hypothetical protein
MFDDVEASTGLPAAEFHRGLKYGMILAILYNPVDEPFRDLGRGSGSLIQGPGIDVAIVTSQVASICHMELEKP